MQLNELLRETLLSKLRDLRNEYNLTRKHYTGTDKETDTDMKNYLLLELFLLEKRIQEVEKVITKNQIDY